MDVYLPNARNEKGLVRPGLGTVQSRSLTGQPRRSEGCNRICMRIRGLLSNVLWYFSYIDHVRYPSTSHSIEDRDVLHVQTTDLHRGEDVVLLRRIGHPHQHFEWYGREVGQSIRVYVLQQELEHFGILGELDDFALARDFLAGKDGRVRAEVVPVHLEQDLVRGL